MRSTANILSVQMQVSRDKGKNLDYVEDVIREQVDAGTDFVILPEMFVCPYENAAFSQYAEPDGGNTWKRLSDIARANRVYLIAGSVPEQGSDGGIYNTAYVFDRTGKAIAKHRKVHLFDINVPGGQIFCESDTLTAGDSITVFNTEYGKMGVCICYDIRFPEMFRAMALRGVKAVFVPAAFNMTTGPAHWEMTLRMRALDNQLYVIACSPARDEQASYVAWGHSLIADPWGEVISSADAYACSMKSTIDLDYIARVRQQLPLLQHRRPEIYGAAEVQEK